MDRCQIRGIVKRLLPYHLNLTSSLRNALVRTPGLATRSVMSSKVQPREHAASTTTIQSRVGPESKFFVNSKGKQIHCSYWRPDDSVRLR